MSRCWRDQVPGTICRVGQSKANAGIVWPYFRCWRESRRHWALPIASIPREPSPATYTNLTGNIARNRRSNIRCEPIAVCDQVGEVCFDTAPTSRENAHIVPADACRASDSIRVPCTTLDAYSAANGIERVSLLKIDTEGYEHAVLVGAHRLLASRAIDMVYFEFCPALEMAAGSDVGAAVCLLNAHGYPSFLIAADGRLKPFDVTHQPLPTICNLVTFSSIDDITALALS
jgi:FkbM family methyltransferase